MQTPRKHWNDTLACRIFWASGKSLLKAPPLQTWSSQGILCSQKSSELSLDSDVALGTKFVLKWLNKQHSCVIPYPRSALKQGWTSRPCCILSSGSLCVHFFFYDQHRLDQIWKPYIMYAKHIQIHLHVNHHRWRFIKISKMPLNKHFQASFIFL